MKRLLTASDKSARSALTAWADVLPRLPRPKQVFHSAGAMSFSRVALFVAITGLGLGWSAFLSAASLSGGSIAGCAGGWFDCSTVLSSRWSSVGPIPVSGLAAVTYVGILAALGVAHSATAVSLRKAAWFAVAVFSFTAAVAAIWFIALQLWVVQHLCVYCLLVHACSLSLGALILATWGPRRAETRAALAVGILTVGCLAVLQSVVAPRPAFNIERFPRQSIESETLEPPKSPALFEAPPAPPEHRGNLDAPNGLTGGKPRASVRGDAPVRRGPWQSMSLRTSAVGVWMATCVFVAPWQNSGPADAAGISRTSASASHRGPEALAATPPRGDQEPTSGKQEPKSADDSTARVVEFGKTFRLNVRHWPIVGSVDAPDLIVEMFDYTCPHCRANHRWVQEAVLDSNSKLAVLALAVPLQRDCNPTVDATDPSHRDACRLAELSAAVWIADPDQFAPFHEWLFEGSTAPTAREAEQKAASFVGADELHATLAKGTPRQYVERQVELYQLIGAGKVPKLLFPDSIVTGDIGASARIQEMLRRAGRGEGNDENRR